MGWEDEKTSDDLGCALPIDGESRVGHFTR